MTAHGPLGQPSGADAMKAVEHLADERDELWRENTYLRTSLSLARMDGCENLSPGVSGSQRCTLADDDLRSCSETNKRLFDQHCEISIIAEKLRKYVLDDPLADAEAKAFARSSAVSDLLGDP